MDLIDLEGGAAGESPPKAGRTRRSPRFLPDFETDIRQLYLRMMDEPVPARLLGVLRAGLCSSKA